MAKPLRSRPGTRAVNPFDGLLSALIFEAPVLAVAFALVLLWWAFQ